MVECWICLMARFLALLVHLKEWPRSASQNYDKILKTSEGALTGAFFHLLFARLP